MLATVVSKYNVQKYGRQNLTTTLFGNAGDNSYNYNSAPQQLYLQFRPTTIMVLISPHTNYNYNFAHNNYIQQFGPQQL